MSSVIYIEFLDLYDDFVAPQLNSDLYTETWMNGRGKLPSECNETRYSNKLRIYLHKYVDSIMHYYYFSYCAL